MKFAQFALLGSLVVFACFDLRAQTLKGVFGSSVNDGSEAAEYRFGYTNDRGNGVGGFAQRLHYQRAVSDQLQIRGVVFHRKLHGEDFDFQALRFEALYQLVEDAGNSFESAARFDLHIADGDNSPGFVRLAWGTQFDVSDTVRFRTNILSRTEIGSGRDGDVTGDIRWQADYKATDDLNLGLEVYSSLGALDDLGSFDSQNHLVGLYARGSLGQNYKWRIQFLGGLSDRAIDRQWRVFLSRSL